MARALHKTVKAVTDDVASLSFNTAISRMMEFVNYFTKQDRRPRACLEPFVLILAPFSPHIAEELWSALGHGETLAYAPWPKYDESLLAESTIELPVQINGKVRDKIDVPVDIGEKEAKAQALATEGVKRFIDGKPPVKVIYVPGRLVNIVVK